MSRTFRSLLERIEDIPVVSVHEHHREDAWHQDLDLDTLFLNSYVGWINPFRGPIQVRAVREWLEVTQDSQSVCWGGDCWTGEESVGATMALKYVLAASLASKIDEGYYSRADAMDIARGICHKNAEHLYKLSGGEPRRAV